MIWETQLHPKSLAATNRHTKLQGFFVFFIPHFYNSSTRLQKINKVTLLSW